MSEAVEFNKKKFFSPYILIAGLVSGAIYLGDYYLLFCLAGIYLGWVCSAPNANLADGFLAQVALAAGILLGWFSKYFFYVGIVCWLTWLIVSVEMGITMAAREDKQD